MHVNPPSSFWILGLRVIIGTPSLLFLQEQETCIGAAPNRAWEAGTPLLMAQSARSTCICMVHAPDQSRGGWSVSGSLRHLSCINLHQRMYQNCTRRHAFLGQRTKQTRRGWKAGPGEADLGHVCTNNLYSADRWHGLQPCFEIVFQPLFPNVTRISS